MAGSGRASERAVSARRLARAVGTVVLAAALLPAIGCAATPRPGPEATPADATPKTAPPRLEGRKLAFADEFDGDRLDTRRWQTQLAWGPTNEGELEYYAPESLVVTRGVLQITATDRPRGGKRYTSGVIASFGRYEFTYGYVEMRARVPSGRGFWPAFWLLTPDWNRDDEIDILELVGRNPTRAHQAMHYGPAKEDTFLSSFSGPDFSSDFHLFAADWEPGRIIWYVDGVERFRVEDNKVPDVPLYLIANLAVGGRWPGSPDASTVFPARYEIDYIRVYRDASPETSLSKGRSPKGSVPEAR